MAAPPKKVHQVFICDRKAKPWVTSGILMKNGIRGEQTLNMKNMPMKDTDM